MFPDGASDCVRMLYCRTQARSILCNELKRQGEGLSYLEFILTGLHQQVPVIAELSDLKKATESDHFRCNRR